MPQLALPARETLGTRAATRTTVPAATQKLQLLRDCLHHLMATTTMIATRTLLPSDCPDPHGTPTASVTQLTPEWLLGRHHCVTSPAFNSITCLAESSPYAQDPIYGGGRKKVYYFSVYSRIWVLPHNLRNSQI